MNTIQKILVYLALGLSVLAFAFSNSSTALFGAAPNINCNGRAYCTAFNDLLFRNASSTGSIGANNLTATGTITLSGTTTASGALTSTGGATFSGSGAVQVSNGNTTSTFIVGKSGAGAGTFLAGCIKIGDSGGATSSPVYVTATGATLSATTTKPAVCQ